MKVEQLKEQPYAGVVFRFEPGGAGLPPSRFDAGCCRESRSEPRAGEGLGLARPAWR